MDSNHLAFELGRAGILPSALEDGLRRAEAHFQAHPYSPEAAGAWCQAQRQEAAHLFGPSAQPPSADTPVWTQLGMTREEFDAYPPAWRMAQARELQAEQQRS